METSFSFGVQEQWEDQQAATNGWPNPLNLGSAPQQLPLHDTNDTGAANDDDPLFAGQVIPLAQETSATAVQAANEFGAVTPQINSKP